MSPSIPPPPPPPPPTDQALTDLAATQRKRIPNAGKKISANEQLTKRQFGRPFWILVSLLALSIGTGLTLCGIDRTNTVATPAPKQPSQPDYPMMLATIDGNAGDPVKVNRYRSLLEQLSSAFVETPEQIADMSANAKITIEKDGVSESILSIMEGMNTVLPKPVENQKYAEYSAFYMTLRVKGQSHDQAVSGLRSLIQSILSR